MEIFPEKKFSAANITGLIGCYKKGAVFLSFIISSNFYEGSSIINIQKFSMVATTKGKSSTTIGFVYAAVEKE